MYLLSGDSLSYQKDQLFSTKDVDNDHRGDESCSNTFLGAWWYNDCHHSNLNGHYFDENETPGYANGVVWDHFRGYHESLKRVTMKVRPEGFTTPGETLHDIPLLLFETYANVSSQICPFLALRSEFHSNHGANSSTPRYGQSATFERLTFCVYTLLFYGIRV